MKDDLLKIGELAKMAGESVSTIRYWTNEKLLKVTKTTQSGYQLYSPDMVVCCELIKKLKHSRLTIKEIREKIS